MTDYQWQQQISGSWSLLWLWITVTSANIIVHTDCCITFYHCLTVLVCVLYDPHILLLLMTSLSCTNVPLLAHYQIHSLVPLRELLVTVFINIEIIASIMLFLGMKTYCCFLIVTIVLNLASPIAWLYGSWTLSRCRYSTSWSQFSIICFSFSVIFFIHGLLKVLFFLFNVCFFVVPVFLVFVFLFLLLPKCYTFFLL